MISIILRAGWLSLVGIGWSWCIKVQLSALLSFVRGWLKIGNWDLNFSGVCWSIIEMMMMIVSVLMMMIVNYLVWICMYMYECICMCMYMYVYVCIRYRYMSVMEQMTSWKINTISTKNNKFVIFGRSLGFLKRYFPPKSWLTIEIYCWNVILVGEVRNGQM
jgi:hypothetical protein